MNNSSDPPNDDTLPTHGGKAAPDHLIVEYQAAQDSAHHHDNLVWSVTSVMWGGSLVLLGFILAALKEPGLRVLMTGLCLLGIALTIGVWVFAVRLAAVKRHKYRRCKAIERELHLQQHTTLAYSFGNGRLIYGVLMALFLAAWALTLCTVWCRHAC